MIGLHVGVWGGVNATLSMAFATIGETLEILGLTAAQARTASFQWLLDDVAISGQTGPSYITIAEGRVSAIVTLAGIAYPAGVATVSAPVAPPNPSSIWNFSISGTTLSILASDIPPAPAAVVSGSTLTITG